MMKAMFIKIVMIIVCGFYLQSCMVAQEGGQSELKFEDKNDKKRRSPGSIEILKNGKYYYEKKCASCHTNPVTSLPTKMDRSYSDIQGAIDVIPQMNFLHYMEESNLKKIAEYLDTSTFIIEGSVVDKLKYKMPLGTRKYVISKMLHIFVHNSNNQSIEDTIKLIDNYPGYFGGVCSYKYENCNAHPSENISTRMLQRDNVARRGFIGKTCQAVVMNPLAITTALGHVSLTNSSLGSLANLDKIYQLFHPGQDLSQNVLSDLDALFKAIKLKLPGEEWKYVLYSLCTSPSFEVY